MSYIPTNWKTGDVVSSERLNKLEEGVKDAYSGMVINDNAGTLDKTWQEIHDALVSGIPCMVIVGANVNAVTQAIINYLGETVVSYSIVAGIEYSVNTSSGYPTQSLNPVVS